VIELQNSIETIQ